MFNFIKELVIKYVFKSEGVHNFLRNLAKKTTNDLDDAGIEGLIAAMIKIASILESK